MKPKGLKTKIIRKSVKRYNLKFFDSSELHLIIPLGMTDHQAEKILSVHSEWIKVHQKKLKEREERVAVDKDCMIILGEKYKILNIGCHDVSVKLDHENKVIYSRSNLNNLYIRGQIYKFLAKDYIKPLAYSIAYTYNYPLKKVFIRGQKSRWGTCSNLGNISLNWKLMYAPKFVIEYVIFHELVHFEHPNHSKAFKEELHRKFPLTDEAETWLKEHSELLKLY